MKKFLMIFGLIFLGLFPYFCDAKIVYRNDLTHVPLNRLASNLEIKLKKDPRNIEYHYQLGRLYSIAFAKDTDSLYGYSSDTSPVFRGYDEDKVAWGCTTATETKTKRSRNSRVYLDKAILHYRKAIELRESCQYSNKEITSESDVYGLLYLGYAWCMEQIGDKQAAINAYRKVMKVMWFVFEDIKPGTLLDDFGHKHEILYEAGECLKNLLDPQKDATEIQAIEQRIAHVKTIGRLLSPIIIPLTHKSKLESLIRPDAKVPFDLDGSGIVRDWGWITPDAGWLVFDPQKTGRITSGLQFFGNVTFWLFWKNGYQALSALDNNQDGILKGSELNGLAIWQDQNSNGISDAGEVKPLSAWGITGLSCRYEVHSSGVPFNPQGVLIYDGSIRPSYDWISKSK